MRPFLIPIALALMLALPVVAAPSPTSQERQAIQAAYQAQAAALARLDVASFFKSMTPNYISIDVSGQKHSRADEMSALQHITAIAHNMRAVYTIQKLTTQSGGVVVTVRDHIQFTALSRSGGAHKLTTSGTSREFWVKTDQGWKMKQSLTLSQNDTVDGRSMSEEH